MKWFAKIIRFPSKDEEEYEYRYRCCDQEYRVKFKRHFKGRWKGRFVVVLSTGVDLRFRDSEEHTVKGCEICGEPIPRPWLGQNKDAFLERFEGLEPGEPAALAAKKEGG